MAMFGKPVLAPAIANDLLRLIVAARGLEVAGVLLENEFGEQRIRRAPNLAREPGEAEVPRWWLDRTLARRDGAGFHPVAFFHSHRSSLEMSATDLESARTISLPWIVLAVRDGKLAWALHG
jgi:proteasome lid subunit RPN8/RPN11